MLLPLQGAVPLLPFQAAVSPCQKYDNFISDPKFLGISGYFFPINLSRGGELPGRKAPLFPPEQNVLPFSLGGAVT